ncbi:tubulin complex component 3 [Seminavis robusta]|uniref:Tubulin complex component 3 n=1 Tax=Seminavis robusta TaxID=568900 RepID=A0A9N8H519_9STRA|nr:tubulin complex component 3 [Seminavis robusta]|eukprot:Sro101_g051510.1 tubulin complex component 3 (1063) ;mRNA; f:30715-33903
MSHTNSAVVRLVQALKPGLSQEEETSCIELSQRIVESQLGGRGAHHDGPGNRPFSLTWKRRIESHLSSNNITSSSSEVEQLYEELTQVCESGPNANDHDLPAKLMAVLTKRIGKAPTVDSARVFTSSSLNPTRRETTTSVVNAASGAPPVQQSKPAAPATTTTTNGAANISRKNNAKSGSTNHNNLQDNHYPKDNYNQLPSLMEFDTTNTHTSLAEALRYEEQQILRELLGALQGIDGKRIKFFIQNNHNQPSRRQQLDDDGGIPYEGIRLFSPALSPQQFHSIKTMNGNQSRLGSGAMDAIRICGESGWLYLRLKQFVDFHLSSSSSGGGRIARALARAVATEMQHYRETLAQWESNLTKWSLRQWLIQIQRHNVMHRLAVLAMLVEAVPTGCRPGEIKAFGGGALLSALYKHSLHGDTRHQSIVQSILYPTSQPWFHMLYLWTTQGMLPASWNGDFFVTLQSTYVDNNDDNGNQQRNNNSRDKYLWQEKYTLDKSQIPLPGIFDPKLVRPAFIVGKGINFIRTCLNQIGWTFPHLEEDTEDAEAGGEHNDSFTEVHDEQANMERLGYHYVADPMGLDPNLRLERTLLRFERKVHSHILSSLREDHNLLEHLFALKQFMFHGQGDFYSSLLEGLYAEFGCGAKVNANGNNSFVAGHAVAGIYPYQLLNILEVALRQTNAKHLPTFCLERLNVEMLPFEPDRDPSSIGHGLFASPAPTREGDENSNEQAEDNRTVWDIFMLDYTVPDPLVAIIHEKAVDQYKLVYSFLFGLRKVEYMLNRTWRQSATLQHALQMIAQNNGLQASSSPEYANATILLRKIAMTRQAMTHFCVNLKSYCMLEVLEGGWKELLERLEHARTLDEAIDAHDSYLEGICRKTLLLKGKRTRRGRLRDKDRSNNKFRHLFGVLLSIATDFSTLQERLFDEALEAAERVAQRRREAERRMNHGQWGFESEQDLAEEASFLGLAHANELSEVVNLSDAFHQGMLMLLEELDAKVHGRSRNMSATIDLGNTVDDDSVDPELYDTDDPMVFFVPGEEQDVDSLRFLMHQLDNNHYYGLLQRR